jgi:hypothetical protein
MNPDKGEWGIVQCPECGKILKNYGPGFIGYGRMEIHPVIEYELCEDHLAPKSKIIPKNSDYHP